VLACGVGGRTLCDCPYELLAAIPGLEATIAVGRH
jgi:hypothetical protein